MATFMDYLYAPRVKSVQAFQMTEERRNDNRDWPEWLNRAWNNPPGDNALYIDPRDESRHLLMLDTIMGPHSVRWGDWIIQTESGDGFCLLPDHLFHKNYEKVVTCEA
jgi:hypothetical protein